MIFEGKYFSSYMSTDQFGNMCIVMVCLPGWDIINIEINLIFLINPFFYVTKKSRQKIKYIENEKSF